MQTVSEFIRENFYGRSMETEEFFWTLVTKVASPEDKETLQRMFFDDVDMEEIAAVAMKMD